MRLRRPPILWPHKIRKRLRLLVVVRAVAVLLVVRVRVVRRADVLHAVDAAALGAAFDGAAAGHIEPANDVAVGWEACAPGELLVTGRVDNDGVVEGACCSEPFALALVLLFTIHDSTPCKRKKTASQAVPVEWRPRLSLSP